MRWLPLAFAVVVAFAATFGGALSLTATFREAACRAQSRPQNVVPQIFSDADLERALVAAKALAAFDALPDLNTMKSDADSISALDLRGMQPKLEVVRALWEARHSGKRGHFYRTNPKKRGKQKDGSCLGGGAFGQVSIARIREGDRLHDVAVKAGTLQKGPGSVTAEWQAVTRLWHNLQTKGHTAQRDRHFIRPCLFVAADGEVQRLNAQSSATTVDPDKLVLGRSDLSFMAMDVVHGLTLEKLMYGNSDCWTTDGNFEETRNRHCAARTHRESAEHSLFVKDYVLTPSGEVRIKTVMDFGTELMEIARLLEEAQIAHSDIKPPNLFVTSEGLKLGDFGSAGPFLPKFVGPHQDTALYDVDLRNRAKSKDVNVVTPLDTSNDIFEFGLLLGEILHGRPVGLPLGNSRLPTGLPGHREEWAAAVAGTTAFPIRVVEEGEYKLAKLLRALLKMTDPNISARMKPSEWATLTGLAYDPTASAASWTHILTANFNAHPRLSKIPQLEQELNAMQEQLDGDEEAHERRKKRIRKLKKVDTWERTNEQRAEMAQAKAEVQQRKQLKATIKEGRSRIEWKNQNMNAFRRKMGVKELEPTPQPKPKESQPTSHPPSDEPQTPPTGPYSLPKKVFT